MDRSDNGPRGRRGRSQRRRWLWMTVAVAVASTLVAMYVYEKSLEDDLEAMLRAALQQFRADSARSDSSEDPPNPGTASDLADP